MDNHFAKGALFENMILLELMKQFLNKGKQPPFFCWKDSNHREVDRLIESGGRLKAVEIKAGKTIQPAFFRNLQLFKALPKDVSTDCYVVYGGDTAQPRSIATVLPWHKVGEVSAF